MFGSEKNVGSDKILGLKENLGPTKLWVQKKFESKKILSQKNVGPKKILSEKILSHVRLFRLGKVG